MRTLKPDLDECLAELAATKFRSTTDYEHLLLAFQSEWVNHEADSEGYCDLATILEAVRRRRGPRIKTSATPPPDWPQAEAILQAIHGLNFWTDRGYLEFRYAPADQGLFPAALDSESFARFVARVLDKRPGSFEQFEELWP